MLIWNMHISVNIANFLLIEVSLYKLRSKFEILSAPRLFASSKQLVFV